ncbi:nuclear transport factor 2 family protein [Paraburkholderia sp. BL6665CI2N2]|uniref:nuclear transport factor 2 family protein n=1 Tax=Paraburkholderia sp. BL6665CI2N2 TaxID=1938806 RepID=UPI001FBB01E7|nr:nuclear transport factor 2 family protein [Paraburkholderia sp. BL6665CI2N2]
MRPELEQRLEELLDRQAILDCIHRYCRGVDRMDRELTLSAYHPDAIDDHGTFVGNPEEFVSWAFDYHSEHQLSHHHMVFNHSVDLQGDVAHTETYWLFFRRESVQA